MDDEKLHGHWRSTLPIPTPADFKRLRGDRTLKEMAELMGLGHGPRWSEYERDERRPQWPHYELMLLWLDQHPTHRLSLRKKHDNRRKKNASE